MLKYINIIMKLFILNIVISNFYKIENKKRAELIINIMY